MNVSRVYSVESRKYVAVYFYPNWVKIVGDMGVLSLQVLTSLLRIMGVVAWLIYVSRTLTKFGGWNLTLLASVTAYSIQYGKLDVVGNLAG